MLDQAGVKSQDDKRTAAAQGVETAQRSAANQPPPLPLPQAGQQPNQPLPPPAPEDTA